MKVTLIDILTSLPALNVLMDYDMPAAVAFRVADAARQIQPVVRTYNERLTKLREKYGVEDNAHVEDTPPRFRKEYEELQQVKVPLHIDPIPRAELLEGPVRIKPAVLSATYYLWEEVNLDCEAEANKDRTRTKD